MIPLGVVLSLVGVLVFSRRHDDKGAFRACAVYLVLMMVGAAVGLYPVAIAFDYGSGARSDGGAIAHRAVCAACGDDLVGIWDVAGCRVFRCDVSDVPGKVDLRSGGYGH